MIKSKVISLEGIDGSGKSSVALWLKDFLNNLGFDAVLFHEPGSTAVGEMLRQFLLHNFQGVASPWTDALLFYAARIENIYCNILPAISSGKWVILDRFQDATIAYQGYGQGLDIKKLETVYHVVSNGFMPDWTILLDCSPDVALQRLLGRSDKRTRWERMGKMFFERVRKGYLDLAQKYGNRITVVDSTKHLDEVYRDIERLFFEKLHQWETQSSPDMKKPLKW